MSKRLNKSTLILLAGLLVLSLSGFGCARNPATDTGMIDDQISDTGSDTGDFNNNPIVTPTPDPNYVDPYANQPVNAMTANVMNKDTKGFWLWKKATGTIMVTNTSQAAVYGTLNITFTLKSETVETQTQSVSLAAGESKQIEVKATKHSDDVTATVTQDNTQTGTGYGNGQYGSQTGTY
ncbi:MAG TPA: hypothetical protein DD435_09185 [Cyanobacteria bacterium UBA8530]|nr:hypothetical protein [Cyanobacteria bacterium UBA8530]